MLAFVTGASSGIGKEMARELSRRGYDLIITGRNKNALESLEKELKTNVKIIIADLTKEDEVYRLYKQVENEAIDVFINNAGFGVYGYFWNTNLEKEINMLKVNDLAMHILFKLILKDMISSRNKYSLENNEKYILNVASLSGFMPGPQMSSYYASKSYMLNLTQGVYQELKMLNMDRNIHVSVLCPGPIYTNFCARAGVEFKIKYLSSKYTARYAINKLFKKKMVIVPGFINKCGHALGKILPSKFIMKFICKIQEPKRVETL